MRNSALLITLALGAGLIGFAFWQSSRHGFAEVKFDGFQAADFQLEMKANAKPDLRFHFLSAWQVNQIPIAASFDMPLGSENGALVYNAQKFWEMNDRRGGHHTGDDLNGIGGMNTDLGDPVFAAGDGLVVFTGEPSPGWGNIIILAHRDFEGSPIHTMYAHLLNIEITLGSLVGRGMRIGSVGSASGHYPAHLHFEMRGSDGIDIGAGYAMKPLNRLDPATVIAALHDADQSGISPAVLAITSAPEKIPVLKE
ncbi:MAG: M23 family metallopeptidase [Armatimonadetes bacterium]|nr:M23 family metallopeptidase [Akkermansiaceae bacterium]